MGLAPYGVPKYVAAIKDELIEIAPDGTFRLNMEYFDYPTGLRMTNRKFSNLFGGQERSPETPLTQREMDLAASIQNVTEEVVLKLAKSVREQTGKQNLCLAGGVALNCVANGALSRSNIFERIWIQPAAGDAGGALGAALAGQHLHQSVPRRRIPHSDAMSGSYLGPRFSADSVSTELDALGASYTVLDEEEMLEQVVAKLIAGEAIGWMQGRMEFGPRALGNRSIIADPRSPEMQRQLNLKIKFRESFRPFAPSVLLEHGKEWFDLDVESPYMLLVANVLEKHRYDVVDDARQGGLSVIDQPRSSVPAVTHVDYSARVQTVSETTNRIYHKLISLFYEETGVPMLVNTSFNVRGEPIVCSVGDAFGCFMGTNLDTLVIGNHVLKKSEQLVNLRTDYLHLYGDD